MSRSPSTAAVGTFRGSPGWARASLGGIVLVAALLYSWNIGYSGISTYYASAAKSMSESWSALLTGAMDPGASMTLDKLSGFLVPQALSIRLFGFHAWALSLPQVIEGMITILASYAIGTRWRGPVAGLATAGIMALTPMLAAMFGRPMEDGMLTMTMVLAFAAWQRATISGRFGWLLIAGAWVAIGFQAKMLQAWLIVPALLLGTLVAGGGSLRRRIVQVLIVGTVTALLSISWMAAIQLIPAGSRPYIDGTTNDNIFSMVFGYNGVDRLLPGLVPGAVPQLGNDSSSLFKLVLPEITTQIGWLYPAAIAGVVIRVAELIRRRARVDPDARVDAGMTVALVAWLGVTGGVLSVAFVPHATYFAVIALPVALLAVVGSLDAIRWYLDREAGSRGVALPAITAATAAWQSLILLVGPSQTRWLAVVVLALGAVAVGLLLLSRRRLLPPRVAVATAIVIALTAPALWSSAVLLPGGGGSASDAFAGPRLDGTRRSSAARPLAAITGAPTSAITPIRAPFQMPADLRLTPSQANLVRYLEAHDGGRRTLFATDTLAVAVSVILTTPHDVLAMGGFSRQAPTIDAASIRSRVEAGSIRFVLLADPAPSPSNTAIVSVRDWVRGHCAPVMSGRYREGVAVRLTLYDCGP